MNEIKQARRYKVDKTKTAVIWGTLRLFIVDRASDAKRNPQNIRKKLKNTEKRLLSVNKLKRKRSGETEIVTQTRSIIKPYAIFFAFVICGDTKKISTKIRRKNPVYVSNPFVVLSEIEMEPNGRKRDKNIKKGYEVLKPL